MNKFYYHDISFANLRLREKLFVKLTKLTI